MYPTNKRVIQLLLNLKGSKMNRFIQVKDCVLIVLATILIVLSTINHMKLLDNTSTDYKVIENVQGNG